MLVAAGTLKATTRREALAARHEREKRAAGGARKGAKRGTMRGARPCSTPRSGRRRGEGLDRRRASEASPAAARPVACAWDHVHATLDDPLSLSTSLCTWRDGAIDDQQALDDYAVGGHGVLAARHRARGRRRQAGAASAPRADRRLDQRLAAAVRLAAEAHREEGGRAGRGRGRGGASSAPGAAFGGGAGGAAAKPRRRPPPRRRRRRRGRSAKCLCTPSALTAIVVAPDGRHVFTASSDGTIFMSVLRFGPGGHAGKSPGKPSMSRGMSFAGELGSHLVGDEEVTLIELDEPCAAPSRTCRPCTRR